MNYIAEYLNNISNYHVHNQSNIFNFLLVIFSRLNNEEKKDFIEKMKIHIGLSFTDNFKQFIFRKLSHSPLLNYF